MRTLSIEGLYQNENSIINLDNADEPGIHWVAYAKWRDCAVYLVSAIFDYRRN